MVLYKDRVSVLRSCVSCRHAVFVASPRKVCREDDFKKAIAISIKDLPDRGAPEPFERIVTAIGGTGILAQTIGQNLVTEDASESTPTPARSE